MILVFVSLCALTSTEPHTVNIRPQRGVTVTSASVEYNDNSPQWLRHTFPEKYRASTSACYIRLVGACAPPQKESTKRLPQNSENFIGVAHLQTRKINIQVDCIFRSVTQQWRKMDRHYLLIYLCPVASKRICDQLQNHKHNSSSRLDGALVTYYDSNNTLLLWNNSFELNTRYLHQSRLSGKGVKNRVVVCAVKPYAALFPSLSLVYRALLWEWVHHYKVRAFYALVLLTIMITILCETESSRINAGV